MALVLGFIGSKMIMWRLGRLHHWELCVHYWDHVLAEKQQAETGERGTSICVNSIVDEHDCIDNNRWWRFVQYTF